MFINENENLCNRVFTEGWILSSGVVGTVGER